MRQRLSLAQEVVIRQAELEHGRDAVRGAHRGDVVVAEVLEVRFGSQGPPVYAGSDPSLELMHPGDAGCTVGARPVSQEDGAP